MPKAVFLDRDGTIIEDVGYPHKRSQIRFLPMVSEAIRWLNKNGFLVIITTNQAGIAWGYFTEETVREINRYIQQRLAEQGAIIDKIYYCPHHIEGVIDEYRKDCYCRKPNPGMIEKAIREFSIDARSSFVIGDKVSDIEAGHRARCQTILVTGQDSPDSNGETLMSDYLAPNLYEAVEWLLDSA